MKKDRAPRALCLAGLLTTLGAGGALVPRPAAAQAPAVGFLSGAFGYEDNAADALKNTTGSAIGSYSLGFEFTANSAASVTALGYFYDPSYDPTTPFTAVTLSPAPTGTRAFAGSHDVGLYQVTAGVGGAPETSSLVAHATVTSTGTPTGAFLYTDLTGPVSLIKGDTYVLAGVTGSSDPYVYGVQDSSGNAAMMTDSAISYVRDRYAVGSGLSTTTAPGSTDAGSEPGFFGPNMKLSPNASAAPEPSEWAVMSLIALGLGGLLLRARRQQSKAVAR